MQIGSAINNPNNKIEQINTNWKPPEYKINTSSIHRYVLSGVEIQFRYEAYPCQLVYMAKVVDAVKTVCIAACAILLATCQLCFSVRFQRRHALLESPTGTGKTVCLLSALLAWRQQLSNK